MSQLKAGAQRREVLFSGRVQGVGFRYTTRQIATRFDVRGFVKNLHDGRVQLVVEGEPSTLERFIQAVQDEMARYIEHREESVLAATGQYTAFEVRR